MYPKKCLKPFLLQCPTYIFLPIWQENVTYMFVMLTTLCTVLDLVPKKIFQTFFVTESSVQFFTYTVKKMFYTGIWQENVSYMFVMLTTLCTVLDLVPKKIFQTFFVTESSVQQPCVQF